MCSELLWRELPHDRDELGPVRFLAPQMAPRLHCFALTGGGCWLLVWVHGLHAKVDRLAAHRDDQRWSRTEARVAALEASALRIEAYVRTVP